MVIAASAIAIAFLAVLLLRTRLQRDEYAAQVALFKGLNVVATHSMSAVSSPVPRRPRRTGAVVDRARVEALAGITQPFEYERARDPRFRSDVNDDTADQLRPVQVVRISSASERDELSKNMPAHIHALFVEATPAQEPVISVPMPRRDRPADAPSR